MNRFAIFVEGETEKCMLRHYIHRIHPDWKIYNKVQEFIDAPEIKRVLIYDCHGDGNVIKCAAKHEHLIPNGCAVVIFGDGNDTCFAEFKRRVRSTSETIAQQGIKYLIIARPGIERYFFADVELLLRTILQHYKERSCKDHDKANELCNEIRAIIATPNKLKKVLGQHGIGCDKKAFAQKFYASFDFSLANDYFGRIQAVFEDVTQ